MASPQLAALVDAAVAATGVPLQGVSIGNPTDKATWRAILDPSATPQQQADAAAAIAAFDVSAVDATIADRDATRDTMSKQAKALVAYIYKVTHGGTNPTNQQLQAELQTLKTIFKNLP